jgi:hypothetical protein
MNCTHCQQELPPEYSAPLCPYCGKNLSGPVDDSSKKQASRKFRWFPFWLVLCIPAVTIWVTPLMSFSGMNGLGVVLIIGVYGSAASGVGGGILLARWKGGTVANQIFTGILFSALCAVVSFTICCASCAVPALIGTMIH